jgi:hypothetical protein
LKVNDESEKYNDEVLFPFPGEWPEVCLIFLELTTR